MTYEIEFSNGEAKYVESDIELDIVLKNLNTFKFVVIGEDDESVRFVNTDTVLFITAHKPSVPSTEKEEAPDDGETR